jgi:hypothetical protein
VVRAEVTGLAQSVTGPCEKRSRHDQRSVKSAPGFQSGTVTTSSKTLGVFGRRALSGEGRDVFGAAAAVCSAFQTAWREYELQ